MTPGRDRHPGEFDTLVALGESTTAGGWSSAPERCWVSVLGALISDVQSHPVRTVNNGIGANVISPRSPGYPYSGRPAASERLDRDVLAHDPDLVVVSYGLNDARCGNPLPRFLEDLRAVVERITRASGALVVLLGPYYVLDHNRGAQRWDRADEATLTAYNAGIAGLARSLDCPYVDVLAANGRTSWLVHHDGVHANDLGHRVIAHRVFETLAQTCSGLALHTRQIERTAPRWRDESMLRSDPGDRPTPP